MATDKQKLIDFSKALLGYNGRGGLGPATEDGGITAVTSASSMTDDLHSKALSVYGEGAAAASPHIENIKEKASEIGEGALIAANSLGGKVWDAAETAVTMVDGMVPQLNKQELGK